MPKPMKRGRDAVRGRFMRAADAKGRPDAIVETVKPPADRPPSLLTLRDLKDQLDRIEARLSQMPVGSAGRGKDWLTRS